MYWLVRVNINLTNRTNKPCKAVYIVRDRQLFSEQKVRKIVSLVGQHKQENVVLSCRVIDT